MKFFIAFTAVLAVASAQLGTLRSQPIRPTPPPPPRPQAAIITRVASNDQNAQVLRYDNDVGPDGSYNYVVEIDNGISIQAQGTPKDFGGNPPVVPVISQGAFSWTSPEGKPIAIDYVADENGYQPTGDAIPTPPPVPDYILRAIDYIAKNLKKK